MRGRITVRRMNCHAYFTCRGEPPTYVGREVWSIWRDGERVLDKVVTSCEHGMTVLRTDGRTWVMADCWHIGIKPGDLARLHFTRED
jgi:hypothetical protein